jgi:hypothetical protein
MVIDGVAVQLVDNRAKHIQPQSDADDKYRHHNVPTIISDSARGNWMVVAEYKLLVLPIASFFGKSNVLSKKVDSANMLSCCST